MAHHAKRVAEADTDAARFWKTCDWLAAEARRTGRTTEVTAVIRELVERVQGSLPLPDAPHVPVAAPDPTAPRVPWYARAAEPPTTDRRDRVA